MARNPIHRKTNPERSNFILITHNRMYFKARWLAFLLLPKVLHFMMSSQPREE